MFWLILIKEDMINKKINNLMLRTNFLQDILLGR